MTARKVPSDPELFNAGLDFYFGVLDSMCGLRGVMRTGDDAPAGNAQAIAVEHQRPDGGWVHTSGRGLSTRAPDTITDRQLRAFAFGRRAWAVLTQLPWCQQELLRRYYSSTHALAAMAGARTAALDCGPVWVESDIRSAHRAYTAAQAAGAGVEECPIEIDQDVSGSTDRAKYRERGAAPRTAAERKRAQRARDAVEHHHNGSARARRYEKEDHEEREAVQGAERHLCGLHEGKNTVSREAFEALVRCLVEGRSARRKAIELGRFELIVGRVEIVRGAANARKVFVAA
ncbi:MAG TPA: hypothetical protein VFK05_08985 [Polyangiaceae bacterium]|nr:hypothetical protein [Polyangiaceae bacterium]